MTYVNAAVDITSSNLLTLSHVLSWIHTSCARIRAYVHVYAHTRAHTLNRSCSQRTILRACARTYAEEFNLVELSRPALNSHPIKCVWEGHAKPTDIDAMLICTRTRAYVHTYYSQRICAARFWPSALPSVAHTRVYARWWSQKVWIQLNSLGPSDAYMRR